MNWTRERPTKAGWYWFRQRVGEETVVAISPALQLVTNICPNPVAKTSLLIEIQTALLGGEWAGPLEPPDQHRVRKK